MFGLIKEFIRRLSPSLFLKIIAMVNGFNAEKTEKKITLFSDVGINSLYKKVELIVSLTSYPARMSKIHYTLFSLLNQTKKPDKIILWLGNDKFPNRESDLPDNVIQLQKFGIQIEWCNDLRSYTKLIPAYKKYPETVIVTADDDVYYSEKWLEYLYNAYLADKKVIHCHRGLQVSYKNKTIEPLYTWKKCVSSEKSYTTFLQGIYGVLYPPHSLYKDAINSGLFLKLAPTDDDTWFWAMAVMNKTKIKSMPFFIKRNKYTDPVKEFDPKRTDTLHYINHFEGQSEIQLNNIINHYPDLLNIMEDDA
jgi:hypothetical protein